MGQLCLENEQNEVYFEPKQTSFSNIIKISAASNHSLFQNTDGEIYGCGLNLFGQIGHYNPQFEVSLILNRESNISQFCGTEHSLFLDTDGVVFSIGQKEFGSLGLGHTTPENQLNKIPNIPPIRMISCVGASSYLLDFDGNVWSFGDNKFGQLGHNDSLNRNIPTKVDALEDIIDMSSGFGRHFLAKDSQGKIFSMGLNSNGQLVLLPLRFCVSSSNVIYLSGSKFH